MANLFVVPLLNDKLLTILQDLFTGLRFELRLVWEQWAVGPRLLMLLLKANKGDWPPLPCTSLALLWLWMKWEEEGVIGVETEEAVEKDDVSSTSSISKDLFSASKSDKIPSRWSFTESCDILCECGKLRDVSKSDEKKNHLTCLN